MSIIGLDVGTSRVKAVRFDEDWREADVAAEPTEVAAGAGGRREQDMDEVWSAVVRVLRRVSDRSPDPVELVAITAQGDGCWLVDEDGRPTGEALLWNDSRAAPVTDRWRLDGTLDAAFAISGCMGAPGVASSQLRWLVEREPDRLAASSTMLSCASWIFARLTGKQVVERSDAANPFCSATSGAYDARLLAMFDLGAHAALLPDIVAGDTATAPLRDDEALAVGLPAGTPVFLAPYDVVSTAVGAGAVGLGSAFAVLGTTLAVGVVADDPRLDRQPSGMTLPTGVPGEWLIAYATLTGTEALDWTARLMDLSDASAVTALAEQSTRSDVPLLLPYLSLAGERSPFLDPSVRGELRGLDTSQTRADIARAVVEGLTLAVLDCVEAAGRPDRLALSGGGSRSDYWCQLVADAVDATVTRCRTEEMGALGAALYGAVALDRFPSLSDAVAAVVVPGPVFEPRSDHTARLHERYEVLRAARATG